MISNNPLPGGAQGWVNIKPNHFLNFLSNLKILS